MLPVGSGFVDVRLIALGYLSPHTFLWLRDSLCVTCSGAGSIGDEHRLKDLVGDFLYGHWRVGEE